MQIYSLSAIATAIALAAPVASACPNWELSPYYGQVDLAAGFSPDPYLQNVTSGGTIDLSHCFDGFSGYVTAQPDFDLHWSGGSRLLTIAVRSEADAVLLVNAPDGQFYYSDDHYGTDPVIVFQNPQDGLYDIWIGSFHGSRFGSAQLVITEYDY